jgi:hypothetical protein
MNLFFLFLKLTVSSFAFSSASHASNFSKPAVVTVDSTIQGQFALQLLEISQQFDSNLVKMPRLVWSKYEGLGLADTLSVASDLSFKRSVSSAYAAHAFLSGRFEKIGNQLFVRKGALFSINKLEIEQLNASTLVILEMHKMRVVRRTFKRI